MKARQVRQALPSRRQSTFVSMVRKSRQALDLAMHGHLPLNDTAPKPTAPNGMQSLASIGKRGSVRGSVSFSGLSRRLSMMPKKISRVEEVNNKVTKTVEAYYTRLRTQSRSMPLQEKLDFTLMKRKEAEQRAAAAIERERQLLQQQQQLLQHTNSMAAMDNTAAITSATATAVTIAAAPTVTTAAASAATTTAAPIGSPKAMFNNKRSHIHNSNMLINPMATKRGVMALANLKANDARVPQQLSSKHDPYFSTLAESLLVKEDVQQGAALPANQQPQQPGVNIILTQTQQQQVTQLASAATPATSTAEIGEYLESTPIYYGASIALQAKHGGYLSYSNSDIKASAHKILSSTRFIIKKSDDLTDIGAVRFGDALWLQTMQLPMVLGAQYGSLVDSKRRIQPSLVSCKRSSMFKAQQYGRWIILHRDDPMGMLGKQVGHLDRLMLEQEWYYLASSSPSSASMFKIIENTDVALTTKIDLFAPGEECVWRVHLVALPSNEGDDEIQRQKLLQDAKDQIDASTELRFKKSKYLLNSLSSSLPDDLKDDAYVDLHLGYKQNKLLEQEHLVELYRQMSQQEFQSSFQNGSINFLKAVYGPQSEIVRLTKLGKQIQLTNKLPNKKQLAAGHQQLQLQDSNGGGGYSYNTSSNSSNNNNESSAMTSELEVQYWEHAQRLLIDSNIWQYLPHVMVEYQRKHVARQHAAATMIQCFIKRQIARKFDYIREFRRVDKRERFKLELKQKTRKKLLKEHGASTTSLGGLFALTTAEGSGAGGHHHRDKHGSSVQGLLQAAANMAISMSGGSPSPPGSPPPIASSHHPSHVTAHHSSKATGSQGGIAAMESLASASQAALPHHLDSSGSQYSSTIGGGGVVFAHPSSAAPALAAPPSSLREELKRKKKKQHPRGYHDTDLSNVEAIRQLTAEHAHQHMVHRHLPPPTKLLVTTSSRSPSPLLHIQGAINMTTAADNQQQQHQQQYPPRPRPSSSSSASSSFPSTKLLATHAASTTGIATLLDAPILLVTETSAAASHTAVDNRQVGHRVRPSSAGPVTPSSPTSANANAASISAKPVALAISPSKRGESSLVNSVQKIIQEEAASLQKQQRAQWQEQQRPHYLQAIIATASAAAAATMSANNDTVLAATTSVPAIAHSLSHSFSLTTKQLLDEQHPSNLHHHLARPSTAPSRYKSEHPLTAKEHLGMQPGSRSHGLPADCFEDLKGETSMKVGLKFLQAMSRGGDDNRAAIATVRPGSASAIRLGPPSSVVIGTPAGLYDDIRVRHHHHKKSSKEHHHRHRPHSASAAAAASVPYDDGHEEEDGDGDKKRSSRKHHRSKHHHHHSRQQQSEPAIVLPKQWLVREFF